MKIVTPGTRHSDSIIRKFVAQELLIPEFEITASEDHDCCDCPQDKCACSCSCSDHGKSAGVACPECSAPMQKAGSMERCAGCGYAEASTEALSKTASAKSAKDTSVSEYYKKIYPDEYAKQLQAEKPVTPPAGKPVKYKSKPIDSKVSFRVSARDIIAAQDAGVCNVPDAHPESGIGSGSAPEKNPEPKMQSGESANSVTGPEKAKSHGVGGSPKDAGDVQAPSVNKKTQKQSVSSEKEDLDLSDGANSVSGPEKADSHGAGTDDPSKTKAPDLKNADRLIPREVIAKWCPECAESMRKSGVKAVKASVIAKAISERAERFKQQYK